tara:strand:+ start:251 stop:493 length:243 start_codon:yes stop_codon:yes gene_type:complete
MTKKDSLKINEILVCVIAVFVLTFEVFKELGFSRSVLQEVTFAILHSGIEIVVVGVSVDETINYGKELIIVAMMQHIWNV